MQIIQEFQLLPPGQKTVVAVSGGADSLCLLHLLASLACDLRVSLHIVHVHHGLRIESDREAVAIKKMAIRFGLPVTICRVNVQAMQKNVGTSLQDAARRVRYGALLRVARRVGASHIAMAHHRDDRVETFLMRLLSGSGLDGLKGIPVRRSLASDIDVVRPLFRISRREIEDYCLRYKLAPLQDPTNLKTDYVRNRVRLHLIPYLEAEFGGYVRRSLEKTMDLLLQDSELLSQMSEDAFIHIQQSGERCVVLDIKKLHVLPRALQARVIRIALWQGGVRRPSRFHVEQTLALTKVESPSARLTLPENICAAREYDLLHVGKPLDYSPSRQVESIELLVPGRTSLAGGRWIDAETLPAHAVSLPLTDRRSACLDMNRLALPLFVRTRKPGDRMQPLGAPGQKKVKKILAERKIPLQKRDQVPLVVSGEQIAWLGGVEVAEQFRVTEKTETVLLLRLNSKTEKDGAVCLQST